MADDPSTDAAEDTSVLDDADTSTDDPEADLEAIEVEILDEPDDAKDEPEKESEESEDDAEETEEEEGAEETEEKSEEETESVETPEVESKALAAEAFKTREAERKLREEQGKREDENLKRYLEEAGDDETERKERQLDVDGYNLQKERASITQEKLQVGIERAVGTIDLFQIGTDEQKEALAESLDDFEKMYVKTDKAGNPVEVTSDVYQHLLKKADSIRKLSEVGARQSRKDKSKAKTRTITPPSNKPKEAKVDPDMAAFDEEANR